MSTPFWRRLRAAVTNSGPGYDLPHIPRRGDDVEQWLKAKRDEHRDRYGSPPPEWYALDEVLDDYRLRADTGTPLGQPVHEGHDPDNEPF